MLHYVTKSLLTKATSSKCYRKLCVYETFFSIIINVAINSFIADKYKWLVNKKRLVIKL